MIPAFLLLLLMMMGAVPSQSVFAQVLVPDSALKHFLLPSDSYSADPLPEGLVINDLVFVSRDRGYLLTGNGPQNTWTCFQTTDGGSAWQKLDTTPPLPFILLEDDFAVSPNTGEWSFDAGETWERIVVPVSGDATVPIVVARARSRFVVGGMIEYPMLRPVWTTDGGEHWTMPDTFPEPLGVEEFDTIPNIEWGHLLYVGDSAIVLLCQLRGMIDGRIRLRPRLCIIHPHTGVVEWHFPPPQGIIPTFIDDTSGYAFKPVSGSDTMLLWWTDDGGRSWTSSYVPPWVETSTFRFFSRTYGAGRNALTFDGGLNETGWQRWGSPFARSNRFVAADSAVFYVANNLSFFGRTTDAGRTWEHNRPGPGVVMAIAVHDSLLLFARNRGSFVISHDALETMRDVGIEGRLWGDLDEVLALAIPDTSEPMHVLGIGTFYPYTGEVETRFFETTDGGVTWTRGDTLQDIGGVGSIAFHTIPGSSQRIGFIMNDSGMLRSDDLGRTWHRLPSAPFVFGHFAIADRDTWYAGVTAPEGQIWRTTNGGESWMKVFSQPPTYSECQTLHVNDPRRVRAIFADWAQDNRRWRAVQSYDGGETWSGPYSQASLPLHYISWFDSTSCYNFVSSPFQTDTGTIPAAMHTQRSFDAGRTFHPYLVIPTPDFNGATVALTEQYWYLIKYSSGGAVIRVNMSDSTSSTTSFDHDRETFKVYLTPNIVRSGSNEIMIVMEGVAGKSDPVVHVYSTLGQSIPVKVGKMHMDNHGSRFTLHGLQSFNAGRYVIAVNVGNELVSLPLIVH